MRLLLLILLISFTYTVSIVDSETDPHKSVIVYCNEERCHRLITSREALISDYEKIAEWVLTVDESEETR